MIVRTVTRDIRVRAMYPGEELQPGKPSAIGYYYPTAPYEIVLDISLSPPEQAAILIHEIIHSIYDERKMPTRAAEETVCTHLGIALAEIIRDNPEIVTALGLALTEGLPIVGTLN